MRMPSDSIHGTSIGIVGARGHVGAELIRLIAGHPVFALAYVSSRELAGQRLADHSAEYAGELRFSAPPHEQLPQLGADAVVLALPNGKAALCVDTFDAAFPAGQGPVIVDLSGPPLRSSLGAGIDFCKVSEEDLSATEGAPPSLHPLDGLEWLLEHGALRAVITRGEESAMGSVNRDPFEVETPTFQVVDHRGAGDAFTALVAAARYWGLDWDDAVRWGAAAGALTVLRRGLATADRNEIHQLLDRIQLRSARP
jgi:sugar/nucleoside kinase (ribokinase family)